MFRKKGIKYSSIAVKNYDISVFEDILLRAMEEGEYYSLCKWSEENLAFT